MKAGIYNISTTASALLFPTVCTGIFLVLAVGALPAFKAFGVGGFLFSSGRDSAAAGGVFSALPYLAGTLLTSFIALLICFPFAMSLSLFGGEYFRGKKLTNITDSVVSLLAGIPSIVYGIWGFYTLCPLLVKLGISERGYGILAASLILAVMIIPYAASLGTEFVSMVPKELKEGAYSLGATHWEVILKVVLPYSAKGLFSAFTLALGRALGETMAVTMVIGNTDNIPKSLVDTGNTMAGIIANRFGEASGVKLSALIGVAFLLFVITFLINFIGKVIMNRLKA